MMILRKAVTLGMAVVLVFGPAAFASDPQDTANSISEQVMSPFCPGVTLHDCSSDNAIQLRAQIARWAAQGWSRNEIMTKLFAEYVDIRAVPSTRGASLLVWLLPAIALLVGGGIVAMFARRWSARRSNLEPSRTIGPHDRRRLEEELALVRNEP